MPSFNESKLRYEEVIRKAQEARDLEKKRADEAKARHVDWTGRAANTFQNMTNAITRVTGDLPVRIDDARDGRGLIVLLRTLDDKRHAELKVKFTDDFEKKQVTCRLELDPDETQVVVDLPEMPASPQPSFDRAKRDTEASVSLILQKFFDRIVATGLKPAGT